MMRRLLAATFATALLLAVQPASAAMFAFGADMTGPAEAPPNTSPATGRAVVLFDDVAHRMTISVEFSGLIGRTTVAHIHCCTALAGTGVASVATTTPSFPAFPVDVLSGTYTRVFDTLLASTYRSGFITANGGTTAGAEAALLSGLRSGKAYFNVHTQAFPGGEIRGFFVPAPQALSLVALLLMAMPLLRRRRALVAA